MSPNQLAARAWTALRKVTSGFPLHSECVWPGVETDLFLAHLSIYQFFVQSASGRRVLDAGSGAGYGSHLLAQGGAKSVLGVDLDARFIRYSRRRYRAENLAFLVADCAQLNLPSASFDLVVSSNVLEHLKDPVPFISSARRMLAPGGELIVAVPWIVDETSLAWNLRNPWHLTNLRVDEWDSLFRDHGWSSRIWVQIFRPELGVPDFFDLRPSRRGVDQFRFVQVSADEALNIWSLGVVFQLSRS